MKVSDVLETCLYADDLHAAEQFYRTILGLEVFERQEGRHVFFKCGQRVFLVFNAASTLDAGAHFPLHGAIGPAHVAFAVPKENLPAWRTYLEQRGVVIEKDMTWPRGGRSLYFRDPAGNSIEVANPGIWPIEEKSFRLEQAP